MMTFLNLVSLNHESLYHGIYRYCKLKQKNSQRLFFEHDCLKISLCTYQLFPPWQGGQEDPRELNCSNSPWSNSLLKGRNCLSNSLLSEPDTMIKNQNLNGQVPQTLDAIICQISAPQAANPINFLRVACPPVVETLHRCITTICILCNQLATSVQNGHYM